MKPRSGLVKEIFPQTARRVTSRPAGNKKAPRSGLFGSLILVTHHGITSNVEPSDRR